MEPLEKRVSVAGNREEVIPDRWHPEPDHGAKAKAAACVVVVGEADARRVENAEKRVGDLEEGILCGRRHRRDHVTRDERAESNEVDVIAGETEVTHVGAWVGPARDLVSGGSDRVIGVLVVHDRHRPGRHTDR
jgi:hypothetical protein